MRAQISRDDSRLIGKAVIFESTGAEKDEQYGGRMVVTREGYLFLTAVIAGNRVGHNGSTTISAPWFGFARWQCPDR